MDGLTKNEFNNLMKVGEAWGVLDSRTAEVARSINGMNLDDATLTLEDFDKVLRKTGGVMPEPKITLTGKYKIGGVSYNDYTSFSNAMWGKGGGPQVDEEKVIDVIPEVEPTGFAKVEYLTDKVPATQTKKIIADTRLDSYEYERIMDLLDARDKTITITVVTQQQLSPIDPGDANGANGLDMIVPPGYADDSYRVNVSSGERVVVMPQGSNSTSSVVNNNTRNNYYNLGVRTSQSAATVQRNFDVMQVLNG
jgi:hypothetical protein